MTFFFTRIFSLILRGNTHISKNFLGILLLGATLSTKMFYEYGPDLNGEKYHAEYLYWYVLGNVLGTKGCHIVWWKWKWSNFRGLNLKTPWKSKWKNDAAGLSILLTFHCSNLKWYSFICMAPACLYACLTASGHAPKETKYGVLGYFLPDLDQGITELLDSLRCNLKHNFPEVFYWI